MKEAAYRDKGYFGTLLPDSVKDFMLLEIDL